MDMDEIEARDVRIQGTPHRRRPVQPPQQPAREIGDLDAIDVDGLAEWDVAVAGAVDAGREYMNLMPPRREFPAQGVNRTDRAAVSHCWQVGRDDVKETQVCLSQA